MKRVARNRSTRFAASAVGQPGSAENERRIVLSDRIQIFVALDFAFGRAVESGSDKAGEHRAAFLGIGFAANARVLGNRVDRSEYCSAKESPISWTPIGSFTAPNAHFDCALRLQGQNPYNGLLSSTDGYKPYKNRSFV